MKKLTAELVRTTNAPLQWDAKVPGLCLRSYDGGTKSFLFIYRIHGRERRLTIGQFPTWSIEAARERAKELRRIVDQGRDPQEEKREARNAPTIKDLIARYQTEHMPTKRAKAHELGHLKTIAGYRETDELAMLDEIARHLGKHKKVVDVHGGDIRALHHAISVTRPVRANRILAVASKAFALTLVPMAGETKPWRDAAMGNPCKGVHRNREEARERFYSEAELARISDALSRYGKEARGPGIASAPAAADCIRLIMLTGCRPQEAMLSRWPEFDAEPGFWVKPSAHTKQRKVHRLPLNPPALELVERLRKKRKDGATWLFPGQIKGEPFRQIRSAWHWVRDEAGLGADARCYDLRHSFASLGAGRGMSLPIIGKLLGHTQPRTTQRYAHLADDPLREATNKIGAVIANAGKAGAQVHALPIKKGGAR
jgi:integrase